MLVGAGGVLGQRTDPKQRPVGGHRRGCRVDPTVIYRELLPCPLLERRPVGRPAPCRFDRGDRDVTPLEHPLGSEHQRRVAGRQ